MTRWIPFEQEKPCYEDGYEVITTYGHQMVLRWSSGRWAEEGHYPSDPKAVYYVTCYYPVAFWRSKPEGDK